MNRKKGFINLILLIILVLIILYYLHIPLGGILGSPLTIQIGEIIKTLAIVLWQDFLLLIQFIEKIATGGTISMPQFNFGSIATQAVENVTGSSVASGTGM